MARSLGVASRSPFSWVLRSTNIKLATLNLPLLVIRTRTGAYKSVVSDLQMYNSIIATCVTQSDVQGHSVPLLSYHEPNIQL
jgi:hypothetical protein